MSDGNRDVRAAILTVVYIVIELLLAFILYRVIVPAIIDAHFTGSLLVGVAVGIIGAVGVVALGWTMFRNIGGLMGRKED